MLLPVPSSERWKPLRAGLVDMFYYDAEEFWFHDGRLLLRGNNGTGKSKVLALTLPFLLDGELTPHRVEPDGDRQKKMEWNLLLGGGLPDEGVQLVERGLIMASEVLRNQQRDVPVGTLLGHAHVGQLVLGIHHGDPFGAQLGDQPGGLLNPPGDRMPLGQQVRTFVLVQLVVVHDRVLQ